MKQLMGNLPSDRLRGERPFLITGVDLPIAPASDDPNDIAAVTPAHLLIGTSLTSAPEAALHHHPDQPGKELRYVDRWQRVAYLKQQFWSLWQRDYVHTLQQRQHHILEASGRLTSAHLTYEELQKLFLDVEAILNSRPIAPASDDPNDIAAVTPAHLLIGTSLTSAPEAALHHHSDQPGKELRYVDRWQRVTYLKQQFWSLWSLCAHSSTTQ
ncbi:hypothetical protein ACLKA7_007665 [Drosophila subpalustris]